MIKKQHTDKKTTVPKSIEIDKRVATTTVCLLIWVAKYATSHMLQSNKYNNYRGRCDRLSVSIE